MRPNPNHWVSAHGRADRCGGCGEEIYNPGERRNVQITGRCTFATMPPVVCARCVKILAGDLTPERAPLRGPVDLPHAGFCARCRTFIGDEAFEVWSLAPTQTIQKPKPPDDLPHPIELEQTPSTIWALFAIGVIAAIAAAWMTVHFGLGGP